MLRLPDEVLAYILRNLYYIDDNWEAHGNRNDILAARAVCRRLADAGAPVAFCHVHVTQDPKGFQRLSTLSNSIHRNSVQLLTYSFEDFSSDIVAEDEIVAYMTPTYDEVDASKKSPELYKEYYHAGIYQSQLHEYNLDVAYLAAAFHLLKNLRSIRISQTFTDRSGPWVRDSIIPHDCADFLQFATSYRILDTVAASLCAATSKVKALTLLSSPPQFGGHWPLVALIESLSLSKSALYYQSFAHLQALHVCIPSEDVRHPINFKGLEDFLCSLPALAELVLTGATGDPVELRHPTQYVFLAGSHLPRLESIQIRNVMFESTTQLTQFLSRHSETLRRVKLHGAIRHSVPWDNSWEEPLSQIRENLNIKVIKNYEGICIYTDDNAKDKFWFESGVSNGSCRICFEHYYALSSADDASDV